MSHSATSENSSTPGRLRPYWTLALFAAIGIVCYADNFIFAVLLTPIKTELHLTDEEAGRAYAVFTLAGFAGIFAFGYLGNRFRRKWLLLSGLVAWSLASAGCGLATTLAPFLVWRGLVGLSEASFTTLSPSWLADTFKSDSRNLVFGILGSTGRVGAFVAYIAGAWLAAKYGWHYAFFAAGIPGLILAVLLLFLKEPRIGQADGIREQVPRPTLRESVALLEIPTYAINVGGAIAFGAGLSALLWGPTFFHRQFNISVQQSAGFFGLAFLASGVTGGLIGGWIGGLLRRRSSVLDVAFLSVSSLAAAVTFFIGFQALDLSTGEIYVTLGILFSSLSNGGKVTTLFDAVPITMRVSAIAISTLAAGLFGSWLGSQLLGYISDHYGLRQAILMVPSGFFVASVVWGFLALRMRHKKRAAVLVSPTPQILEPA